MNRVVLYVSLNNPLSMKNFIILPALFASVAVFAQVEEPVAAPEEMEGVEETTDYSSDYGSDVEESTEVTASGTVAAVEEAGGLLALEPTTAVANIEGWIAKLDGVEGGADIQDMLKTLKEQLTAETIDGSAVAETLTGLSAATEMAGTGDADLEALAGALEDAAMKLKM